MKSVKLIAVVISDECGCDDSCPAIYRNPETGSYVVQGLKISPEVRAGLTLPSHEEAVELPAHIVEKLVRHLHQQ